MILTLTLAAGLLAAPQPQPEPPKGWIIELGGYKCHKQAELQIDPVEAHYVNDVSAFFKQFEQWKKR